MEHAPRLRAAVAQIETRIGDLQHNLQLHLDLIAQARAQQADLLVFPELSLTGYGLGSSALHLARCCDDPLLGELAAAACGIDVVFGFVEEGCAAQLYNAAAVVRDGQLRHVHRKLNLPTYGRLEEGKIFAAGQDLALCPIKGFWNAGVLICADLWNPALVHATLQRGATILLAPICSALGVVDGGFSNPEGWDLALHFYAMIYGTPILMANHTGSEGSTRFWGGSRIVDAHGQTIAQMANEATGIVCADLDYRTLRSARFNLPTLRDSNPDLIARLSRTAAGDHATSCNIPGSPPG